MSDKGFWSKEWMDVQRSYWEQWSELNRKALGDQGVGSNPWEEALDHWWQAVQPSAPVQAAEFMRQMMDQGKHFFRIAELFGNHSGKAASDADMQSVWQQGLEALKGAFGGDAGEQARQRMMAFWELPLGNWQRMASSMSPLPGDFLRNIPRGDPSEPLQRFLSVPGLGYSREEQQRYQNLAGRVLEYQQALAEYSNFFSGLAKLSVERLQQKFEQLAAEGKKIDSARALYDLWVSACEEVYGEQVMQPQYSALHGRLINALVGVKYQMAVMVDENLGALNMPTRRELRTLQGRLQQNRREINALKAELAEIRRGLGGTAGAEPTAPVEQRASESEAVPAPVRKKRTPARKKVASRDAVARKKGAAGTAKPGSEG